jgi:hypothetical protein
MPYRNRYTEKRQNKRYIPNQNIFINFNNSSVYCCQIDNINQEGISVNYLKNIKTSIPYRKNIDIFFADFARLVLIENIPTQTIWEKVVSQNNRSTYCRCGLTFKKLTPAQAAGLEFILKNHSTEPSDFNDNEPQDLLSFGKVSKPNRASSNHDSEESYRLIKYSKATPCLSRWKKGVKSVIQLPVRMVVLMTPNDPDSLHCDKPVYY